MGDSGATTKAKLLRNRAASLLRDAARCTDATQRDALLNEALARLNEARLLLNQVDDAASSHGAIQPTARIH